MAQAAVDERQTVVGALMVDDLGRVFVHRRSWNRRLFPGCWDIVGGHVEAGEGLHAALEREIAEETGWQLRGSPQLIYVADWEVDAGSESLRRREFDFLVEVQGDLNQPRLEFPKHLEYRWLDQGNLALLDENRGADDGLVRRLVELALRSNGRPELAYPHATIFLDHVGEPVELLRREWDPATADQIAAHITVAYPSEAKGIDDLLTRVSRAVREVPPFRFRLGRFTHSGSPDAGVFIKVEDVDGGWSHLRRLITYPESLIANVAPHVTVVHPRTTNRGGMAWQSLQNRMCHTDFAVARVAVTAFDGRRWLTIGTFDLGGSATQLPG